jgi:hypothetical protein
MDGGLICWCVVHPRAGTFNPRRACESVSSLVSVGCQRQLDLAEEPSSRR